MKIQCIGSAGGYPSIANPTTSYLVSDEAGEFQLLIDAGSGSATQIQRYMDPADLNAIWVSHDHPDHVADLGIFQHLLMLRPQKPKVGSVPIYLHPTSNQFDYLLSNDQNKGTSHLVPYQPDKVLDLGLFKATFCLTTHSVTCYALKLYDPQTEKTFVYTADSAWNNDLAEFVKGVDTLLIECNFPADHPENKIHYNSTQVVKMAKLSGAKTVIVTHIPPLSDDEQIMTEIRQGLEDKEVLQAQPGEIYHI